MDEVRMTRPRPDAASGPRHACTERMVPLRVVPRTWSMSSSVISASDAAGKIPALAHSTSMPPSLSVAVAAIRSQSSRRLTSARTCETSAPPADSSVTAALAASSSRPTMSTRAPAPAKTLAMPLPMPRVAPVTTTARPAIDVNMLAFPFPGGLAPQPAEVGLSQVAAAGGVPGAEFLCDVHRLVRADPGDQQQPAEQDERPDLGLVLGGQVEHPAVPRQPRRDQLRHRPLVLGEAPPRS